MGQRHQIYVVLPYEIELKKDCDSKETISTNIVPIHHQWLYGVMAGKQLQQFLNYCTNGKEDEYFIFGKNAKYNNAYTPDVVESLYSINIEEGYYYHVSLEEYSLAENPLLGDNNDGITIIDLRQETPKYCFMFIGYGGSYSRHYVPIDALEYMSNYYGDEIIKNNKYWQEQEEQFYEMQEEMNKTWDKLKDFILLTLDEVKELFPKMFEELNTKEE